MSQIALLEEKCSTGPGVAEVVSEEGSSSNVVTGTQVEGTQEGRVMTPDQSKDQPLSGTTDTEMGLFWVPARNCLHCLLLPYFTTRVSV